MVLTRFWLVLLALGTVAGLAVLSVASGAFNRQAEAAVTESLGQARSVAELVLKVEARQRIDKLAPVAQQPDVRSAVREASARASLEQNVKLSERLRTLNSELKDVAGDMLIAVDTDGRVVGAHGVKTVPRDSSLAALPVVERALAGYLRDDVWVLGGVPYRLAARPVLDAGGYAGAVLHAMRIDDRFAEIVSTRANKSTVAFLLGGKVVAQYTPPELGAVRAQDLAAGLESAVASERYKTTGRSDAVEVPGGRAVYTKVTGAAGDAGMVYAIADRFVPIGPFGLTDVIKSDDRPGNSVWGMLAGIALGAVLIGMLAVWLERDRPLTRLIRGAQAAAQNADKGERLALGDFGGRNRVLAVAINDALDHAASRGGGGAPIRAAKLDELLGDTPETEAEPPSQFFGFSSNQKAALSTEAAAGSSAGGQGAPVNASDPPTVAFPKPPAPAAKPQAPQPPMKAAAPPKGVKPLPPTPQAKPAAPAPASLGDTDDDPATAVAAIPDELLSAPSKPKGPEQNEEAHFREVFDRYIVTKRECGENTDGLTFERFSMTLRKNKETIVAKSGVSRVHFSVYVKDGKAALKATPVK